ncbi:hypothetical protein [Nitrosospira sp. Nsp11]|uniref:hypothetical protein n=1 Tax=Nitrosospira sp. Nsp11 TaxID=1855338 RepID=UPI001160A60C|nr:hypothetical protein [Nitrosospira sp. Nsp11]
MNWLRSQHPRGCSMGVWGEPKSPWSQFSRDEVGAHPIREGLVRVSGHESPDWRCNGHNVALAHEARCRACASGRGIQQGRHATFGEMVL